MPRLDLGAEDDFDFAVIFTAFGDKGCDDIVYSARHPGAGGKSGGRYKTMYGHDKTTGAHLGGQT